MSGNYAAETLMPSAKRAERYPDMPKRATLRAIWTVRRYLVAQKPDLVVCYNWGSVETAAACILGTGIPFIQIQDGFSIEEADIEDAKRHYMRRAVYPRAARVIVPSNAMFEIASRDWDIPESVLVKITNGIEPEKFQRQDDWPSRKDLGLPSEATTIIGTVAALRPEKDIGRMIEAFRIIVDAAPDTALVIVGDGIGRQALGILAERIGLGDHVYFTGMQPSPEHYLAHMDVFLMSSDTEQLPMALLEAMAAGLPVCATDVGDIRATVTELGRPYIEGRSADILAKNCLSLLLQPGLRAKIGTRNTSRIRENHNKQTMFAAYSAAYKAAIKR